MEPAIGNWRLSWHGEEERAVYKWSEDSSSSRWGFFVLILTRSISLIVEGKTAWKSAEMLLNEKPTCCSGEAASIFVRTLFLTQVQQHSTSFYHFLAKSSCKEDFTFLFFLEAWHRLCPTPGPMHRAFKHHFPKCQLRLLPIEQANLGKLSPLYSEQAGSLLCRRGNCWHLFFICKAFEILSI